MYRKARREVASKGSSMERQAARARARASERETDRLLRRNRERGILGGWGKEKGAEGRSLREATIHSSSTRQIDTLVDFKANYSQPSF